MITDSYDLDTVEEADDVALNINLTFKTLVNVKARCTKCKVYGYYDYQCSLKSQYIRTVSSDDVDDSKVIENVHVSSKTANIIEGISVGSNTPIINEVHMSSDNTSDIGDALVEPNILTVPSKSFEFFCAVYNFMVVSTKSYSSESSEFLAMI